MSIEYTIPFANKKHALFGMFINKSYAEGIFRKAICNI